MLDTAITDNRLLCHGPNWYCAVTRIAIDTYLLAESQNIAVSIKSSGNQVRSFRSPDASAELPSILDGKMYVFGKQIEYIDRR